MSSLLEMWFLFLFLFRVAGERGEGGEAAVRPDTLLGGQR